LAQSHELPASSPHFCGGARLRAELAAQHQQHGCECNEAEQPNQLGQTPKFVPVGEVLRQAASLRVLKTF
jgi:hypothetical protein